MDIEVSDLDECPLCCDDPCSCFEGIRICERCGKEYTKYSRIHTCQSKSKHVEEI